MRIHCAAQRSNTVGDILNSMTSRSAKRVFAIAGRLLLVVALLFATGPWAGLLAATRTADCAHMMSTMQHSAGNGADCCAEMGGDHGMPDCGKQAASCSGICQAMCGLVGTCTVPAAAAFPGFAMRIATPLADAGVSVRSLSAAPALRPPISL